MALGGVFISLIIALSSVLVYFVKRHYACFKRQGIPHDKPELITGNMQGLETTRHFRTILVEYYNKYKHSGPFAGIFLFFMPAVVVFDLDVIKNILIKDFNNFTDRGMFYNERDDPLSAHIFSLDGEKWKNIRNKLSPTFTSGKMKLMFPMVVSVGKHLIETLNAMIEQECTVEVKDIMARFTVDVIGTCAFGIECNSLKDPSAEFRIIGAKAFTVSRHSKIVDGFIFSFPKLARKLRMRQIHEDVHQFYMRVVRETVEYREKNSIKRNDFMNLLIEIKNSAEGMTLEEIAAQAFIFFVAGFETTSTTMGFALFELALNHDIQDKLREEINTQLELHDGQFTYESMSEMHYMEMVIKETLRKYSIVSNLMRKTTEDYPTNDPKYTISKGMMVIIPTDAIHRDPEIYPDPEKFDPERFTPDEMKKRHSTTWLPFGDGPRNCIGLRFGKMQIYVGLAMLLKNFKFHYCEKTPNPLEIDPTNPMLVVKGGIYLRIERI